MPKFSLEKLNEIKKSKYLTFKDIAGMTGMPRSTVEKIFGGFNSNPSINSLLKIADVLECGIDDFIEYEKEPSSPYYFDRKTVETAREIYENPALRNLFNITKHLAPDDITAAAELLKRIRTA